ncbi:MAG: YceI family protein [bacterium]
MHRLLLLTLLALMVAAPLALVAQDETETAESAVAAEEAAMSDSGGMETELADTTPLVRNAYFTVPNDAWNFYSLAALAPLNSTYLQATGIDGYVLIAPDSLPDSLVLRAEFDLAKLSTGQQGLDTVFFNKDFLKLDSGTVVAINLLKVTQSDDYLLINEVTRQVTATAELSLGGITDTVVTTMGITYLAQNEVTARKMSGNLLHVVGDFGFKLSDFGINIPRPALLRLPDRMQIHFDFFATSESPGEVSATTE